MTLPPPPVRVCLVAPLPPPYGGIGHWASMVLRHAAGRDDVRLDHVDIAPRWRAIDDTVFWKRVVGGGLQLVRDFTLFLIKLRHHPRVIHLTTSGQLATFRDLLILRLAKRLRIPVLYHLHFGRVPLLAGGSSGEWKRLAMAMRLAHTVVVIDKATELTIRAALPGVRVKRIPNCYESRQMARYDAGNTNSRAAVFIGWIIPAKGIEELFQAWNKAVPEGWFLQIIGPGRDEYQDRLIAQYRPRRFEFLGERTHDQAMEYLARAELLIFPSHTEGFPNVVLEAMTLGKPIVASAVGAIPEMLEGGCGLLVPPRDAGALAAALTQAIGAGPEARRLMGERARARAASRYESRAVLGDLVALWKETAGLPPRPGPDAGADPAPNGPNGKAVAR